MQKKSLIGLAAAGLLVAFGIAQLPAAQAAAPTSNRGSLGLSTHTPHWLPTGFVKLSVATNNTMMGWIPGLGTLYVNPSTMPAGPYYGYDKKGKLVNVTYLLPVQAINSRKNWMELGRVAKDQKIDHTDIYTGTNPGKTEPMLHIVNWLVTPTESATMGTYVGIRK